LEGELTYNITQEFCQDKGRNGSAEGEKRATAGRDFSIEGVVAEK